MNEVKTDLREIVLDTETTGLDPNSGHRIVEIGCLELINHMPTGKTYHQYINPQRDMPEKAFEVHGLSKEYLEDFPLFDEIAQDFVDFVGDSIMVIHNAEFDMKFLNAELSLLGRAELPMAQSLDTVRMARAKFPGSPANLDALCRRFNIDNANRQLHGALLDAELLAEVYLELIGGRQRGLELSADADESGQQMAESSSLNANTYPPRTYGVSSEEEQVHAAFMAKIVDPIWHSK